ncbi:thymus-specific serine protease [Antennarius striatus]|uniref:thymus-specific serine protease n=1 Tax=Antennarius striatus TaxID=241820 RepID=UPI0035B08F69
MHAGILKSLLAKQTIFLLLWLFAAGEKRLKGFQRFEEEDNSARHLGGVFEDQWFIQKLDHFNGADDREWKQRYFVNEDFYRPGGPVFLMIGGEGTANPAWMRYGTWITYAEKLGALCFMLEHRFYGKSHPTPDLSKESLQFLSSRQALADLAHFRTAMAEARGLTSSKWVAFGGSYPGALAAWFRLKYPHLVHASVASSAPVFATVDFPEYLEVVRSSLASEDPQCPLLVKQASDALVELLKNPKTYDNITQDFRLCSKLQIQTDVDLSYFLEMLAGNFMDVVQYNEDNREFEGVKDTGITIQVLCGMMADPSLGDPYARYAAVARLMLEAFSIECLNVNFSSFQRDTANTSWEGPSSMGERQWLYQTCSEFGFYQTTDSPNQPFSGFPLQYFLTQCAEFFNISAELLDETVEETNEYYSGYDIHSTRIVFPNGSIDPWHALGITMDITPNLPAVFIKGTAHCADMYPARSQDLPQLTLARERIFTLLQQWLKQ